MTPGLTVGELTRRLDETPPFDLLPVVEASLREAFGARTVGLLLSDYGELTLERLTHGPAQEATASLPIEGTVAGTAYREQVPGVETAPAGVTVSLPVTVRSERLGVLEVVVPAPPTDADLDVLAQVASTLAYVIANARRYTDTFERVRRRKHLTLPAELQWELLPVLGYDATELSLAGMLEPAYEVGGDNFDYAVTPGGLTVSISDAVGHGLGAALMAGLAVTAMRNVRRAGGDLVEQAGAADRAVGEQFEESTFVTTLLMNFDLATGRGAAVNAGHSHAWRVRAGRAAPLELAAEPPLGLFPDAGYRLQPVELEPGDRLVLITDGVLEAGPERGRDSFGPERLRRFLVGSSDDAPAEMVRSATRMVLDYQGRDLDDDATVLCVDWRGEGAEA